MPKVISISLNKEDEDYLEKDELLKPSSIFRMAMQNIRESRKNLKEDYDKLLFRYKTLENKYFDLQEKHKDDN